MTNERHFGSHFLYDSFLAPLRLCVRSCLWIIALPQINHIRQIDLARMLHKLKRISKGNQG
ncbi:MAG: hypothetical protein CMJ19_14160 [Phycisphaeraceae bacterium]|nr:hypothetical protein [Phycisphaeraceae bacterium]